MAFRKSGILNGMSMVTAVIAILALWATVSKAGGYDLVYAAYYGDLPEVKRLLAAGAEVNAQDKSGKTALMFATRMNHPEVRELLIKAEAN